jgi:adenylosuccinate lyase
MRAAHGALSDGRLPDSGVRALFTVAARRQRYLDVEAALALAQADCGLVPSAAADAISSSARLERLDKRRLAAGEARTGHFMMAIISELSRVVGDEHGGWVHWGATTQNIQQTGDVLGIREAHRIICGLVVDVLARLADLAEDHADTLMAGRTHAQQAVPITFGFKVAAWADAMLRHLERLDQLTGRLSRLAAVEFGELAETLPPGDVGSSTMPQKRNAKLCSEIITIGAQARALVPLALEAVIHSHEVDGARSAMMDEATEQALILAADALIRLRDVLGGLQVFDDRMSRNLELTGGSIMAEAAMMALAGSLGRQHAHDVIHHAADLAASSGQDFADVLARDPSVTSRLTSAQVRTLLDPHTHTGRSSEIARQTATRTRTIINARGKRSG